MIFGVSDGVDTNEGMKWINFNFQEKVFHGLLAEIKNKI